MFLFMVFLPTLSMTAIQWACAQLDSKIFHYLTRVKTMTIQIHERFKTKAHHRTKLQHWKCKILMRIITNRLGEAQELNKAKSQLGFNVHTSISCLSHLAALSTSSSYFNLHSADSSNASLFARSNCLLQKWQCATKIKRNKKKKKST